MCSISVDPMPSRISCPNASLQRRQVSAGSGSAAETHARIELTSRRRPASAFRMALKSVGTEKNSVGRSRSIVSSIPAGVGLVGYRIVDAPTEKGNERLLPSPYAWNSTRPKTRSLSRMART